jgi:hypothetical protein
MDEPNEETFAAGCREREAKVERKRYREFTVTPGLRGFKVKIGCSEVYFADAIFTADAITDYLTNPQGTERKFLTMDIRLNSAPMPTCALPGTMVGQEIAAMEIRGGLR